MNKDIKKVIAVEGKEVLVMLSCDDEWGSIDFILNENDAADDDALTQMVGWNNPIEALKNIGAVALDMVATCTVPVYFNGSSDKRNRVYSKMLKRAGITHTIEDDMVRFN